jgi:peptide/nickel transport system permease protein
MKYLFRRTVHGILLLIGASILCFLFSDLAPGGFFDEMKLNPQISSSTIAALRTQYGLDRPLPVRYGSWVQSVFRGEFGYSFAYNTSVRSLVLLRARNTLVLTSLATILAWLIAVPLGVWIASHPGKWVDRICMGGTSVLISLSELVLVLSLLYFAVRTHALPVGGMVSTGFESLSVLGKMWDLTAHLIVPAAALTLASLPILVRHVRACLIEVLETPFVESARAHGIGRARLLFRHALPAAANPLISLFGLSVGGLLSGSLLVEVITGWPGLGPLLLESSISRDLYVVVGIVMASTVFMICGNLLADIMLVALDPRLRADLRAE